MPLSNFSSLFKADFIFKDFSREFLMFKDFSSLYEPCLHLVKLMMPWMASPWCETYLKFIMLLSIFDPVFPLSLGVNEQWVSWSLGYNDTILCGQLIVRQTLEVPFTNLSKRNILHYDTCMPLGYTTFYMLNSTAQKN